MQNNKEKLKSIESAILSIEKEYGKGSIMKLGSEGFKGIKVIPSGSLMIDKASGIGGYPRGRIIEIFGTEAGGKTTLALHAIAEVQKLGGVAAFVDAEHALDPIYAKSIGVNIDDLWVSQPDNGEQALEIVEKLVSSEAVGLIVVDSVAALTPRAEIEGDMGASHMGLQARLMSQALRKLTGIVSKTDTCVIMINQLRSKIGVVWGSPEVVTGGNALKYYATQRIDIRKIETIKEGGKEGDAVANKVRVKYVKNKLAPPFTQAEVYIEFGKGLSKIKSLIDAAVSYNIIKKAGSWYSYNEEKLGQGSNNVEIFLKANENIYNEIDKLVRDKITNKPDEKVENIRVVENKEEENEVL